MARNQRKFPKKDDEDLRETIRKLKSRVKKLQKENNNLRGENSTLLDAWAKTESFLQEVTAGVPLEKIIEHRKLPSKAIKPLKKKKEETVDIEDKEEARLKWIKWRQDNL